MTSDALARPSLPGRERGRGLFLIAAIGLTLTLAWLLVAVGGPKGSLMLPAGFFAVLITVPLVLRKPIVGLYILFAAAVIIETDRLTFGLGATSSIPIFRDINGLTGIKGLWMNPVELLIILAAIGWLLQNQAGDHVQFKPVPLLAPLSIFIAVVGFGVVHGLLTGGDIKTALWTVRPLAYFYLAYLLTLQLLSDRHQVTVLLWIFILGVALKGAVGWWRYYVDLGSNLNGLNGVTGMNSLMAHEESFFYLGILLLAGVQFLYGAARRQRTASLLAGPLVIVPFLANQRRAGSLALIIAFALLCLVTISLLPHKRRLVLGGLAVMAVVLPFYAAFSWNTESLASEPVRAVKSGISPESRDLASNEYRDAENFNLKYTVRHSPLIGIGFGKQMTMVWPLPDISDQFAWYKIAPHNSLLWIMMTTGIVGFVLFWYVIGLVSVGSIRIARQLAGNVDKGIAVFAVLMLASLLVFALLDQGLLSMRTMLFTGVLLGAVFTLPRLNHNDDEIDSDDKEGGPNDREP